MRGYVKLEKSEDKGLIVAAMDNIKFFPKGEYVYKLIFARQRKRQASISPSGQHVPFRIRQREGSFRINPKDLDGSGTAVWDFFNCNNSRHVYRQFKRASASGP